MVLVIDYGVSTHHKVLSNILPVSPDSLAEVFGMLLNFTLTSQYATYSPPRRLAILHKNKPPKYVWSVTPAFTLQLGGRTQVLRQPIHDLGSAPITPTSGAFVPKRTSLTAVVVGRDIFLPPSLSTRYPNLTLDLESLASEMAQTSEFSYELTTEMISSFDRWDELLQALGYLLQMLEQSDRGEVWHLAAWHPLPMFQIPE